MATRQTSSQLSFIQERLRLPLVALGVFAVLAGLAFWFVEGQFTLWPRVLVAAGVLLLGVFVALDPADVWNRLRGRTALYGGNVLLIALASLAILGLVNVLASRYQTKWDLTANQQYTLSEQSIKVVESLPQPVKATAFYNSSSSQRTEFEGLLSDYASHSNGKFTYEFVDPDQRPSEAIAAGIRDYGTTVLQMGDKKQNVTGSTERDLTTGLIKLTRPSKKVYFTTGHGERSIDGFERPNYGQVKQALERDNFTVSTINLATTRAVPDDADELVIAGPTSPFLPEELQALRAYLDGGGKVMLLLDPGSKADFNDILKQWDVKVTGNPVFDPGKALGGDAGVPVVDSYKFHVTTQDLRLATFFPGATNIDYPQQPPAGATVSALAMTTDRSWAETSQDEIKSNNVRLDASDQKGPLALVVAIEQDVKGTANQSQGQQARKERLFLVGTANFVSNQALSLNAPAGNLDLFLNAANWLADQTDLVAIRPKDTVSRTMLLTGTQLNVMFLSTVLLLPLAVLAAGTAVWWTRR